MSLKLAATLGLLLCLIAVALSEPRVKANRGLGMQDEQALQHPYLFLTVPRGRSGAVVQGFQLIEEPEDEDQNEESAKQLNDDEDDGSEDDDDEDDGRTAADDDVMDDADDDDKDADEAESDEENENVVMKNAKPTHMMVSREHAGAILVPDGFIEIEGHSVIDPKTGKSSLLVPKSTLDAVPDGSVVALMERTDALARAASADEERANRVIVRRRRKGARRNVRRRGGNRKRGNRRRGGNRKRGNRRRVSNRRRTNVRVVNTGNRRRNVRRRGNNRRRVVMQG